MQKFGFDAVFLCVDDDLDDIEVFCDAVKTINPNYRCITARNGKEAIDLLNNGLLPDCIFLDINMPIMNGKQTLKEIRKNTKFQNVPVIMYSTTIHPKDAAEYKQLGATEFLVKASQFEELCKTLTAVISKIRY
jgi:CheY-like chemotaxis protein